MVIEVELVDYSAHILRQGDMLLQQARGDAQICGLASLDVGLKMTGEDNRRLPVSVSVILSRSIDCGCTVSGRADRNDVEFADPRPSFSGTSSPHRGATGASRYFWELANLGGRKISFGFVPGLVMLWPCWLKCVSRLASRPAVLPYE
jgi:hypothetical protein